jgi:flagellar hook-associated protein 3 FlgL
MTVQRITNQMVTSQVLSNINASQSSLDTTEEQLSSGLRINEPSDDPYGASLAVQLNTQLSQLSDYSDNITDGEAWTSAGLSAMSSITDQLQRAQELVVQAGNGSESATDLADTADELQQLMAGIKSDANAQYDGQYIFSGTSTSTQPYSTSSGDNSYSGGTGAVSRTVGSGQSVDVTTDLDSVLNGSAGSPAGLLNQLQSIYTQLTATPPDTSQLNTTDLSNLQSSLSALTAQSASLGAAQDRLQLAATRISDLQTSVTGSLSDDQEVNMATAMTTYSNEQAAFQAALKAGASIVQTSLMDFLNQ